MRAAMTVAMLVVAALAATATAQTRLETARALLA